MRKLSITQRKIDPWQWDFTVWALLGLLIVGIVLVALASWPHELDTSMKEHLDIEHK